MKLLISLLLSSLLYGNLSAAPTEVIVTIANPHGWSVQNDRADSDVSITANNPRSGDGSLEFNTTFVTAGQDKVDYQLDLDPATFTNRILNNLTDLSFEYYRDSVNTSIPAHFHPALRLGWYNDFGTPLDTSDDTSGFLIYEEIYQGVASVTENSWVSKTINFGADNFWMFCNPCSGGTGVVPIFTLTLDEWKVAPPIHALNPTDFTVGNTYIFAVNTGIGSGWGGDVKMWVDNIRISFGASDDFNYNFEINEPSNAVAVPLFSNIGLLLLIFFIFSIGFFIKVDLE